MQGHSMNGQAGKGDSRRPSSINDEQFAANWALAFRGTEEPFFAVCDKLDVVLAEANQCGPGTTTEIGTLNPSGSIDGFKLLCTKHPNAEGHFLHPCPTCNGLVPVSTCNMFPD